MAVLDLQPGDWVLGGWAVWGQELLVTVVMVSKASHGFAWRGVLVAVTPVKRLIKQLAAESSVSPNELEERVHEVVDAFLDGERCDHKIHVEVRHADLRRARRSLALVPGLG